VKVSPIRSKRAEHGNYIGEHVRDSSNYDVSSGSTTVPSLQLLVLYETRASEQPLATLAVRDNVRSILQRHLQSRVQVIISRILSKCRVPSPSSAAGSCWCVAFRESEVVAKPTRLLQVLQASVTRKHARQSQDKTCLREHLIASDILVRHRTTSILHCLLEMVSEGKTLARIRNIRSSQPQPLTS
jgi:hypothetical protein